MKRKVRTCLEILCSGMLAMLGFPSCDNEVEDMYGTVYSKFEINGEVTDENGNPVDDAMVIVRSLSTEDGFETAYGCDTVKTETSGKYIVTGSGTQSKVRVVAQDPSGKLEADSTEVNLDYKNIDSKNIWGRYKADATVNFKLKEKKNDSEASK